MIIKGRTISKGKATGQALVSKTPITFLGGVDPKTGIVVERGHELEGQSVTGRILIFPTGKGSSVGSFVIYQMAKNATAPAGIINVKADEIVAAGAIISDIPMMDSLEDDPLKIKDGTPVTIDATRGCIEVED